MRGQKNCETARTIKHRGDAWKGQVLNDEQRRLVEINHNLIYHVLRKMELPVEEYYDVAAIGLCKAGIRYDESLGYTFSTYACLIIRNYLINELIKQNRKCRNAYMTSLDEIPGGKFDLMSCVKDDTDRKLTEIAIAEEINKLPPRQRFVLRRTIQGHTVDEIARELGVTNGCASSNLYEARKKIKKALR